MRGLLFLGGFLALPLPVVLLLELLDPAGGVEVLHLAREERMAGRADFDSDALARAARDELVAAATRHRGFDILGMDALFHDGLTDTGSLKLPYSRKSA